MVWHTPDAYQPYQCLLRLASSEELARSDSYLEIFFQQLLCSVFFKQIQIFVQNTVFFNEWHAYKHGRDVQIHYSEKLHSKVSKRQVWWEIINGFRS